MGGVGKTTEAISIARDPDVRCFVKGCTKKVIRDRVMLHVFGDPVGSLIYMDFEKA